MQLNYRAGTAASLPLLLIITAASGADWFVEPAATFGFAFEENADLSEEERISTTGYILGVGIRGGQRTERSQVSANLSASFARYPGSGELDSDDLSATVNFGFQPTELDRLSLDLSVVHDTSRTSELTTTGDIAENVPRFVLGIGVAWERQLSERSVLSIGYARSGARFDSNLSGLVDSQQDDIQSSYSYQLTERLAFSGGVGATIYEPDNGERYKGYDTSLGMSYAFSETLAGSVDIGWQWVDRDTGLDATATSSTANGTVYGFSLSKAFERSDLSLSLRRSVVPTGSGEPFVQEGLNLGYGYRLSPWLSASLPIGIFRNRAVKFGDAEEDNETRLFLMMEPSLNWRVTDKIVLKASYRYQYQRFEEAGTAADGNAVFLSLSYAGLAGHQD